MSQSLKTKPVLKIFDSWAVLAWLKNQLPAADLVDAIWQEAKQGKIDLMMSIINLGEVFYITAKEKNIVSAELVLKEMQKLPIVISPAPNSLVIEAARLKGQYAIAYADAFAVATAQKENAILVTGDPEIKALIKLGIVQVEWIGS